MSQNSNIFDKNEFSYYTEYQEKFFMEAFPQFNNFLDLITQT